MSTVLPDDIHPPAPEPTTLPDLNMAMADASPDAIVIKDRHLRYIACNAAFRKASGKREEEIIGGNDFDFVSKQEADICRQGDRHVLATGEAIFGEEFIQGPNGLRCLQITKTPLRKSDGTVAGVIVISRDVTDRKQAEESGQLHVDRYETLLRTSQEGFWIMGREGMIRDANQAFCNITGYSREELLGMHITDLEAREKPEETQRHIGVVMNNGYDRFETRHRRKDGAIIDVEISTSYWSSSGEFLVFCRDITERMRAEAQRRRYEAELRKARKLAERENESKTRFLATASHDLRQPIQAMHLLSHLLVSNNLPPESAEIALRLQEAVDGLGDMLTALLDISKLDAGLIKPELVDFKLSDLLQQLTDEHLLQVGEKGINLRCVCSSLTVHTDHNLLTRILRNLISNAVKYTPSGRVLVGVRRSGRCARIQVIDTGIGIAEEELGKIFEEFHQLGNTARDRREGLGLGLAIVRRLSLLLGHPVEVASAVGRGTRFSVQVPLALDGGGGSQPRFDSQLPLELPCEGAEILVVDDEVDIREGLAMSLRQWGYAVSMAADFDQAVAVVKPDNPPVLVIADYRLGEETGIDVIRTLRRQSRRKIAALLLTGDATEARKRESARLGVQLLRKPVPAEQLRRAVIDCLAAT